MDEPGDGGGAMMPEPAAPLAYYWGDDGYSVGRAPDGFAARLSDGGGELGRWRVDGNSTTAEEIAERVATSPLFGGGTLVIVREPGPLVSSKGLATRLQATLQAVAPGNGLAFLETFEGSEKNRPASLQNLEKSVREAGGEVRQFKAPKQHEMAAWIQQRAAERSIRINPAAAAKLAERIGAFVTETDVDRRRQGELAVAELEKLALYRLDETIRPEDVEALVTAAVPGSTWSFLDAVATRRTDEAAALLPKLTTVPPVLLVQLHRRIRELIIVAELQSLGMDNRAIVAESKLNPYVAQKLAQQVRRWTMPELEAALDGLLEVDAGMKNGGEGIGRVAVELWLAEKIARRGAEAGRQQR